MDSWASKQGYYGNNNVLELEFFSSMEEIKKKKKKAEEAVLLHQNVSLGVWHSRSAEMTMEVESIPK